jgi:hypothetical protein
MRALALSVVLLAPALAACSGSDAGADAKAETVARQEDERVAAWRTAVEDELGSDGFDLATLQQDAARDCLRTDVSAWTVELALSGDVSTSTLTRIGLEHACPDVVPAFDEAVAAVAGAADPLDLVCGPGVELGSEDALKADLVCTRR